MSYKLADFLTGAKFSGLPEGRIQATLQQVREYLRQALAECQDHRTNWEINTNPEIRTILVNKQEFQSLFSKKRPDDLAYMWLQGIASRILTSDRVPLLCDGEILQDLVEQAIGQDLSKFQQKNTLFQIAKQTETDIEWDHPTLRQNDSDIYEEIRQERSFLGVDLYDYIQHLPEEDEFYQVIHQFLVRYAEEEAGEVLQQQQDEHSDRRISWIDNSILEANRLAKKCMAMLLDRYYQGKMLKTYNQEERNEIPDTQKD